MLMTVKRGPKVAVDESPLDWKPRSKGADQLKLFGEKFLITPKGKGARKPFKLHPWQHAMTATLYEPSVSMCVWVIPRGNGKSGLAAAIALHHVFMSGIEGARCIIVAQDERRATSMLNTAIRMVQLSPELEKRAKIYRDRIEIPGTNSAIVALPGEAHRIEGEDATLVIVDEIGFVRKEAFEAAILSTGKRGDDSGKVLAIGTPSPAKWRDVSPLWDLVIRGRADPDNPSFRLVEFGADPKLPIDDPETWRIANPAFSDDGWLTEQAIRSQLPPVTRELEFRRARLGQWTEQSSEPAFPADKWARCERAGVKIPPGAKVVLALDGSASDDSTAVIVGSLSKKPHYQIGGLWEPHKEEDGYHVNHLEVEDTIRELCNTFDVVEIVADPYRWQRSLQVLAEEGLPVHAYPQTPQRQTPATNDLRGAVNAGLLTHSGEVELSRHVLRASVEETSRGVKLVKQSSKQKIDLAVCLMMAHSRITWLAGLGKRRSKVRGYKT